MKGISTKTLFTSILFLSVFAFSNTRAQSWSPLGTTDFSSGSGYYTSLVVAGGIPYVAYENGISFGPASVMKYSGGNWQSLSDSIGATAQFTSIAINPKNGYPYIVYSEYGHYNQAIVLKYDGTNWDTVGKLPYFTAPHAQYTNIAIDTAGTPYVVYIDGNNGFQATVKKYIAADSTWVTVGGSGFSTGEADFCSIAINTAGTPYVAFQDANKGYRATVMQFNGASWVTVGTAGFSAGPAYTTNIAIDSAGIPYVVYADYGNHQKATVMEFIDASWVLVGTAGFSDSAAAYTTIAIAHNGTPFVAYTEGRNGSGGRATAMEYTGGLWQTVCSPRFSPGIALYTSIAVDSNGEAFVAYSDSHDYDRVSVMSPCSALGIKNVVAGSTLSIFPSPASTELTIQSTNEAIRQVTITNLLGQTVYNQMHNTDKVQLNVFSLPVGVYFVKVNDTEVRKFVKE